jgi:hypothetical protein
MCLGIEFEPTLTADELSGMIADVESTATDDVMNDWQRIVAEDWKVEIDKLANHAAVADSLFST